MQTAKLVTTPLIAHFRLSSTLCPQSDEEVDYMSKVQYSSVVGFFYVCHDVFAPRFSLCS